MAEILHLMSQHQSIEEVPYGSPKASAEMEYDCVDSYSQDSYQQLLGSRIPGPTRDHKSRDTILYMLCLTLGFCVIMLAGAIIYLLNIASCSRGSNIPYKHPFARN